MTSDETQRAVPGKDASADVRVRTGTHKARSAWFQAREAWPLREAPIDQLLSRERARVAAEVPPAPGTGAWRSVGPDEHRRPDDLRGVSIPTEPERLWAGAAGGGVWHSRGRREDLADRVARRARR